jgi:hypothetical protein
LQPKVIEIRVIKREVLSVAGNTSHTALLYVKNLEVHYFVALHLNDESEKNGYWRILRNWDGLSET